VFVCLSEVEVQENNSSVTDHPLSLENNIGMANDNNSLLVKDSQNNAMSLDGDTGYVATSTGAVTTQHGCCLTLSDHDRLRIFIHEFIVRGLIPWAERMLRTLSEQVHATSHIDRLDKAISWVKKLAVNFTEPLMVLWSWF